MSWEEVSFVTLYAIPSKNGLNRPSKVRGKGHKMINMGELFANDRIGDIDMELVPLNEHELSNMLVQEGDLLFARQSLVLAGAGKCSIVEETNGSTTFESHIIRVRLRNDQANSSFYHYYFKSPACRIKSIVTQGVQAGIRGNDLKKLSVHRPPLRTQQSIASTLSTYDDLIENNLRRIDLLEQSARLLYEEWFVRLRFPGYGHSRVKDGVPDGWGKVPLSKLCSDVRISVDPSEVHEETPYIGLEHLPRRSITLSDWGVASEVASSKFRFESGDILFGKIRPYFHKVGFSLTDGITSSDAVVIRPKDEVLYFYCLLLLSSDRFVDFASKTVREGSKMPRADWKFLLRCQFILPNMAVIRIFNDFISKIVSQLKILALQNQKLKQTRDLLLPKLMDGEIAV